MAELNAKTQLKNYKKHLFYLALCIAGLYVGIGLNCIIIGNSINMSLIKPEYFLGTVVFLMIAWPIYVKSSQKGGFPDNIVEWSWTLAVLLAVAIIAFSFIIPGPFLFVQLSIVIFGFFMLHPDKENNHGSLKISLPVLAFASLAYLIMFFIKWKIIAEIQKSGSGGFLEKVDISVTNFICIPYNKMVESIELTRKDLGLETIVLDAVKTRNMHLMGLITIGIILPFGYFIIGKIRSFRRNYYFEGIAEQTGFDIRMVLDNEHMEKFLAAPVEEHHDLTIKCLKEIQSKVHEQKTAIKQLSSNNANLPDETKRLLLEIKTELIEN